MQMLDFLLPSKARRGLLHALCGERVRASVSSLARRAGVTPAAARKEVEQMLSLGLLVAERDGRERVVRANDKSPHVHLVRKLLADLDVEPGHDAGDAVAFPTDRRELVRAWLGHYGAPLVVTAHPPAADVPPLEQTLVQGLRLAHHDATVALVLPLVLWNQRANVDLSRLVLLATGQDEAQSLGFFLELTADLSGHNLFRSAADNLRDRRYRTMRYFFPSDSLSELSRGLAQAQTSEPAKRWHFYMNMPFDSFASHFRKFTGVQGVHS
jgi:DNA-binding transcriptional ArsR family regulator